MTIDVERLARETSVLLSQLQRRGRDDLPPFPPSGLPQVHRTGEAA